MTLAQTFFGAIITGMNTAQDIIEAAGRDAVKARFDVRDRVVQHYLKQGAFPASWYVALCEMTGAALPVSLFSFKGLERRPGG